MQPVEGIPVTPRGGTREGVRTATRADMLPGEANQDPASEENKEVEDPNLMLVKHHFLKSSPTNEVISKINSYEQIATDKPVKLELTIGATTDIRSGNQKLVY